MRRVEYLSTQREFKTLPADVLMEWNVVTIQPTDSCRYAASQLTKGGFGSLPVVDDQNRLLGIISEYDLLDLLREERNLADVLVSEVMSKDVQVVQYDTPAKEICDILQNKHLIRVPVVHNGHLVGIVARRDVLLGYIKSTAKYWP
ncbi:MAG TPA: CBS domain-containing protein [Nitrospiria bacterium]|jgi:CBS domain-containing protein